LFCPFSNVNLVVINLDRAILNRLGLNFPIATPFELLTCSLTDPDTGVIGESEVVDEIRQELAALIMSGINVAICNESSRSFVSTACHWLGIDLNFFISTETQPVGLESQINALCSARPYLGGEILTAHFNEHKESIIYVSDLEDSTRLSSLVNCWSIGFESSSYKSLVSHALATSGIRTKMDSESCVHSENSSNRKALQKAVLKILETPESLELVESTESNYWNSFLKPVMPDAQHLPFNPLNVIKPYSYVQRPVLNPVFMTRYEYSFDIVLRNELFESLRGQFPEHNSELVYSSFYGDIQVCSHFKFQHLMARSLLVSIKNWRGRSSGPEVLLLNVEFLALVMASSIVDVDNHFQIVPVPSSELTEEKPGQVSIRLARRIAQLTSAPIAELLSKVSAEPGFCYSAESWPWDKPAILIDDQFTTGSSIRACIEALEEESIEVFRVNTWSSNKHE
jgi:hypothetical protein